MSVFFPFLLALVASTHGRMARLSLSVWLSTGQDGLLGCSYRPIQ